MVMALSVGEDDVESGHHVFDLAVTIRELARAPTRQPTADRRQVDRLRPMTERLVVRGPELVLERGPERAGPDVDHERRVVDVDDAGQRGEVEDDAAVQRDRRSADAAAPPGRSDRNFGVGRDAYDGSDLICVRWSRDHRSETGHLAVECPGHRERPPVPAALGERRRVGRDGRADVAEAAHDVVAHLDALGRQPRRDRGCATVELDGSRRLPGRGPQRHGRSTYLRGERLRCRALLPGPSRGGGGRRARGSRRRGRWRPGWPARRRPSRARER